MQVNSNLNPLTTVNITLRENRLQFNRPIQLQENIEKKTNVLTKIKITNASRENTIYAIRYNSRSIIQRLRVWCKQAVVVEHLGTKLLVSVDSLKRITRATKEQINALKQEGKLIQFISMSLALKNLGHEAIAESVMRSISAEREVIHLAAPTSGNHPERLGFTMYLDRQTNEVKLLNQTVPDDAQATPSSLENQQNITTTLAQTILNATATALNPKINENIAQIQNSHGEVEQLEIGRTLGKGTYGKIIQVKNQTGLFQALKYSRKRMGEVGVNDVQKEYGIHRRIFGDRTQGIWGFQRPIIDRFAITLRKKNPQLGEPSTKTVIANRIPIYSRGDYFAQIAANTANREFDHLLPDFQQMMYTLHYMEQHKMSHGDIKPQNILVDEINGVHVVHLSDLTSMAFESDGDPGIKVSGTPAYTPMNDLIKLQSPQTSADKKHEIKGKRDVFAIGKVMYTALTGRFPYQLNKVYGWPINTPYRPVNDIHPGAIPPEFESLLERMLTFDPDARIGRTEAWNEFNRILVQYPEVQAQIAANMQALGFDPTAIV